MNRIIEACTARLTERSRERRSRYLDLMHRSMEEYPPRRRLSCGNLAHAWAACSENEKSTLRREKAGNLGIVTAYNDMLSAHQPLATYPEIIKQKARALGCTAQVAGGVPAMCDGVTQGQPGMELSLFSRDVIAMATAVSLSHNMFDAHLMLGVCDKIVPGLLVGALQFGHIPAVFIPAGPMPSGISNREKAKIRQQYEVGEVGREQLLATESAAYHSPGTCTFYGTANSNQLLMELLGVQLAGASFVNPGTELRRALTENAVERAIAMSRDCGSYRPLYQVVTEKSLVNAVVGLLATGGSTNHTLHLVTIAAAAGIELHWEDIEEIAQVVPLLAQIYPNGQADINQFQQAGGIAFLVHELRRGKLLHEDVVNVMGEGLESYEHRPKLATDGSLHWHAEAESSSKDHTVLRNLDSPFSPKSGLRLLRGNLGQAIIKVSAVADKHLRVKAPCRVFHSQQEVKNAFKAKELFQDMVVVVRFQGPAANGMPELHQLTPALSAVLDRGYQVALVTDGRMSGASGKVPAAIHLSPEAQAGGAIGKLRDGDCIQLDAEAGVLEVLVAPEVLERRSPAEHGGEETLGRSLFGNMRRAIGAAELGAHVYGDALFQADAGQSTEENVHPEQGSTEA